MREIRPSGSEGGGVLSSRSPYPYQRANLALYPRRADLSLTHRRGWPPRRPHSRWHAFARSRGCFWSVPGEAGGITSVVTFQPAASPRVMDGVSDNRLAARLYRRPELYGARIGLRVVHRAVRDRPLDPAVHVFHHPDFDAFL